MDIQTLVSALMPYQPKKVILFGSHAYGKPHEHSDMDVAIIKNTTQPYHNRLIEVRRLIRTTQPIDFFVFTEQEIMSKKDTNPLIDEIMTKGKVVYPSTLEFVPSIYSSKRTLQRKRLKKSCKIQ